MKKMRRRRRRQAPGRARRATTRPTRTFPVVRTRVLIQETTFQSRVLVRVRGLARLPPAFGAFLVVPQAEVGVFALLPLVVPLPLPFLGALRELRGGRRLRRGDGGAAGDGGARGGAARLAMIRQEILHLLQGNEVSDDLVGEGLICSSLTLQPLEGQDEGYFAHLASQGPSDFHSAS